MGALISVINPFEQIFLSLIHNSAGFAPRVLVFFFVFYLANKISRFIVKYSRVWVATTFKMRSTVGVVLTLVRYAVVVVCLLPFLSIFNINLTPLLAGAGILTVVVGVTVAPILSGYVAGFSIMRDKPYDVGDKIELLGSHITGFVEEVDLRATKIKTLNGNLVVVPNSSMMTKDLVNYSAVELRTMAEMPIGISYESDLDKAIELIEEAARSVEGVKKKGTIGFGDIEYEVKPKAIVSGFGQSTIDIVLRVWFSDPFYIEMRRSEIYKKIYESFKKNGIEIPYPRTHFIFDNGKSPEKKEINLTQYNLMEYKMEQAQKESNNNSAPRQTAIPLETKEVNIVEPT